MSFDAQVMDKWYRKLNQLPTEAPVASLPIFRNEKIVFNTSEIGNDSLMTVRIQIAANGNFNTIVTDTLINWKNIFGVDANFNPIDQNGGVDLLKLSFNRALYAYGKTYSYRVKYRYHNLKWSEWSNVVSFNTPKYLANDSVPAEYALKQNFPNPFNPITYIVYNLPQSGHITLKIYNILGNEILTLINEEKTAGQHQVIFDGSRLSSGVYFYKIQAGEFSQTKKLILIK